MIKLKICGMRDPSNILEVASLHPHYMGFIFYSKSPRYVGEDFILPENFSDDIKRVGVFVNASTDEMLKQVQRLKLDYLQLHGKEPVEQLIELKEEGIGIIKVFSVDDDFDFEVTKPYKLYADYFLFDTKGKYYGGNAQTFNWRKLEEYDQDVPFFLSGGLTPENIHEIKSLQGMNIHAVDMNSGVEISPGLKSKEKVTLASQVIVGQASSLTTEKDFFNPDNEIHLRQRNLPHWIQEEVYYFVTFRLADSIPADKVEQLKNEREVWLKDHQKKDGTTYSKEELTEYYRLFSRRVEEWLNNGYGSCILKDDKVTKIVADALLYFNGERYLLDEWIIMPNHVHVLVKPLKGNHISDILHSWKSFTANKINKLLNTKGQVWMSESYDHIVRNENALVGIRNYIRMNPVKAGIKLNGYAQSRSGFQPDNKHSY